MKTHMHNTQAKLLANDVAGHRQFINHQQTLHGHIKPIVVTKRKQQIRVVGNNKVELNTKPQHHVNLLYEKLHSQQLKSTIDNKKPYQPPKRPQTAKHEIISKQEHERELRSMQNRIENCKNLQQRKKDKIDPITNPVYFIKPAEQLNGIAIDSYSRKVLAKNRPKSAIHPASKINTPLQTQPLQSTVYQSAYHTKPGQVEKPLQQLGSAKYRPQSAKRPETGKTGQKNKTDLPVCTFKGILDHIVQHKIFKDTDIKVLYVRLCHHHGEENVEGVWEELMRELER